MDSVRKYSGVKGEAKQIVTFKRNGKASLDAVTLGKIIASRPGIENLPTIVVTMGGETRGGKSFLLNLLASYLAYLEENGSEQGWMQSACVIKGICWAKSGKSITHGIWMFNQPFIITRCDGSKAAVLLVDSQGTGDNLRSIPEIDTLITYIGLRISSIQVLNVKGGYLNADELLRMDLCTDYAEIDNDELQSRKETHQDDHLFQSLLFLIRDYVSDDDLLGDDPNLFPDLIIENETPELRNRLEGIKKAFLNISSYKMPHPGLDIAKATEADELEVKAVPPDFLESVRKLARKLFALEQPSDSLSQSWKSAAHLLTNFEMVKYHIETDDLPRLMNPSDALQESVMYNAFAKLQQDFGKAILEKCQSDDLICYKTEEDVKKFYDKLENEAFDKFKIEAKYRKYEGQAIACKYLEMSNEFFKLMRARVMSQFECMRVVSMIQKEREEIERDKRDREEQNRMEITHLESKIDEQNQRQQDSEVNAERVRTMERFDTYLAEMTAKENEIKQRIEKARKEYLEREQHEEEVAKLRGFLSKLVFYVDKEVRWYSRLYGIRGAIAGVCIGIFKSVT